MQRAKIYWSCSNVLISEPSRNWMGRIIIKLNISVSLVNFTWIPVHVIHSSSEIHLRFTWKVTRVKVRLKNSRDFHVEGDSREIQVRHIWLSKLKACLHDGTSCMNLVACNKILPCKRSRIIRSQGHCVIYVNLTDDYPKCPNISFCS
jgi:hypothetical protein